MRRYSVSKTKERNNMKHNMKLLLRVMLENTILKSQNDLLVLMKNKQEPLTRDELLNIASENANTASTNIQNMLSKFSSKPWYVRLWRVLMPTRES